jgi:hypothetical protein
MSRPLRALPSSNSSETPQPELQPLGSITPRLWTRPLRKLTPRTSYGFAVIHFAAMVLRQPLDPWQQWVAIHIGELLPDGRPRFRQALIIVARQNGKTHLCKVLALFWMFVEKHPMVFGTSTDLEQAKEAWEAAVALAEDTEELADRMPPRPRHKKIGNGQQVLITAHGSRYKIGASNSKGGRGKTIPRQIGDELRQQHTWEAYDAAVYAMNAVRNAQMVFISNAGSAKSVVLNSLRSEALAAIDAGDTDVDLGLFEYSAPPGSHPTDVTAHAAANPQYGRRMDREVIIKPARSVSRPGADPVKLAGFLTEVLCMTVSQLDPAIDPAGWAATRRPAPLDLTDRARLAAVVDVALDLQHATLAVAAVEGDTVRGEVVASWDGPQAVAECLRDLPGWIATVRPRHVGWFPAGPAATIAAQLKDRAKTTGRSWAPRGTRVSELTAESPAVCMGLAQQVAAGTFAHSGQALLDAQAEQAEKLWTGDRWVFTRRGAGHVDALYSVAGAVHLARTVLPPRKSARRLIVGPPV